jgi:hypothetical protein
MSRIENELGHLQKDYQQIMEVETSSPSPDRVPSVSPILETPPKSYGRLKQLEDERAGLLRQLDSLEATKREL